MSTDTVATIATQLRNNPRYVAEPRYNQFHEKLLASIARYEGDNAAAIEHLRLAISFSPSSELNMMMVTALASDDDFDAAKVFIDDARANGPPNPLHAFQWQRELNGLRAYIDELERLE